MIPRYTRPEMARIWAPERRLRIWLDVEMAACEAMVRLGQVPAEDLAALKQTFDGYAFTQADVARIDEIERTVKHDVIAFLTWAEEKGGAPAPGRHEGDPSPPPGERDPVRTRRTQGEGAGERLAHTAKETP